MADKTSRKMEHMREALVIGTPNEKLKAACQLEVYARRLRLMVDKATEDHCFLANGDVDWVAEYGLGDGSLDNSPTASDDVSD